MYLCNQNIFDQVRIRPRRARLRVANDSKVPSIYCRLCWNLVTKFAIDEGMVYGSLKSYQPFKLDFVYDLVMHKIRNGCNILEWGYLTIIIPTFAIFKSSFFFFQFMCEWDNDCLVIHLILLQFFGSLL